ncbi:fimbrial protein [Salmonella enterica]|nr:fimbrial protein [Salmonella enterica]EGM2364017.1 fimbrial protein [Salmonella enterica]
MRNLFFVIISLSLCYSGSSIAVDFPITIFGNVQASPCDINNGQKIVVDFGELYTEEDQDFPAKTVDLTFSCISYAGSPYIKITGNSYSEHILKTNIDKFGIALYQGKGTSVPLKIGEGNAKGGRNVGYRITNGLNEHTFSFTAKPVWYSEYTDEPASGSFSASATVSIVYI